MNNAAFICALVSAVVYASEGASIATCTDNLLVANPYKAIAKKGAISAVLNNGDTLRGNSLFDDDSIEVGTAIMRMGADLSLLPSKKRVDSIFRSCKVPRAESMEYGIRTLRGGEINYLYFYPLGGFRNVSYGRIILVEVRKDGVMKCISCLR